MNARKFILEAVTLIAAAVLCALVSNALAARERKLALVGFYPNAQKVPAQATEVTGSLGSSVTGTATATVAPPPIAPNPATQQPRNPATPVTQKPSNPVTSTQTPPPPPPAKPKPTFPPHPDKPYIEIKYDDVKALHDSGALVLDARRTSVYEQGHVAGARPFSIWEADINDKVRSLWEQRQDPKEQAQPIVIYCSGGDCEDSHMLAQKLWGIQFNNVYVYKDGYPDWVAHHGATRTGPTP